MTEKEKIRVLQNACVRCLKRLDNIGHMDLGEANFPIAQVYVRLRRALNRTRQQ